MNKIFGKYTLWLFLGIIAASVTYSSRTTTSEFHFDGPALAIGFLSLMTAAFPFVILRKAQDALIAFRLLPARVTSSYWLLLLPACVLWGIQFRWASSGHISDDFVPWSSKPVKQFCWGGGNLLGKELLLLLIIFFLHEVYLTVKAVGEHKTSRGNENPESMASPRHE